MSTDTARGLGFPRPPRAWLGPLRAAVRATGFWLAVVLPLAYVPLLTLAPGLAPDPGVLAGVLGANLFALAVGHGHEPSLGRLGRGD